MPTPSKLISVCFVFILLSAFLGLTTAFCAQESEVNTNTMAGKLFIMPNGNTGIWLIKSHIKSTVGDMITGKIAEDLTVDQADKDALQRAAYLAYNAWLKCKTAKKKAADGKISKVQSEFECARYRLYSADEVLAGTKEVLNNNLGINWVIPVYAISKLDSENAKQDEQNALNNGAVPTPEGYQPPGGPVAPPNIPIDISVPVPNTNVIIDTLPIQDTKCTTCTGS